MPNHALVQEFRRRYEDEMETISCAYCARSQPTRNTSNSGILEAGMVIALGPPLTA
jgi:hypothetical protein